MVLGPAQSQRVECDCRRLVTLLIQSVVLVEPGKGGRRERECALARAGVGWGGVGWMRDRGEYMLPSCACLPCAACVAAPSLSALRSVLQHGCLTLTRSTARSSSRLRIRAHEHTLSTLEHIGTSCAHGHTGTPCAHFEHTQTATATATAAAATIPTSSNDATTATAATAAACGTFAITVSSATATNTHHHHHRRCHFACSGPSL